MRIRLDRIFRFILLACFVPASLRAVQPDPVPGSNGQEPFAQAPGLFRGSICLATGIEKETGRNNAWVTKLALQAGYGPFYAECDASAAYPERALDSAGAAIFFEWKPWDWLALRPQALARWRSFGTAGHESRFGAILNIAVGAPRDRWGFSVETFGGYTYLISRVPVLDLEWGDHDPVMGLDLLWHNGSGLVVKSGWATYTPDDAGLFMKTFFKFGGEYRFHALTFLADLTVKYTDILTLTAYLDGYSLRFSLRVPLEAFFK